MENKKVSLEEMISLITEQLNSGGTFEIPITGTSMLPLLVQGRDFVVLKKAENKLNKDDIPLYKRTDGHFVLHRVFDNIGDLYSMCGDNQWVIEKGINSSQVIGIVVAIRRKGKIIDVNSMSYKLYCKVWRLLFPIRKYIVKIRGKLAK